MKFLTLALPACELFRALCIITGSSRPKRAGVPSARRRPGSTIPEIAAMPHRVLEHTADLRLEVTSGSYGGLFKEALLAMTEWTRPEFLTEMVERFVIVEAADRTALLIDFLNEVLAMSQISREAYDDIRLVKVSDHSVEGILSGKKISGAADEIKAVTYHGAQVDHLSDGTWSATLLMDI